MLQTTVAIFRPAFLNVRSQNLLRLQLQLPFSVDTFVCGSCTETTVNCFVKREVDAGGTQPHPS